MPNCVIVQACCHKMGSKRVVLVEEAKTFADAKLYCQNRHSGSLVVVDLSVKTGVVSYEDLHILAGIAPPDGAWIGLEKQETSWRWINEGGNVDTYDTNVWGYGTRKGGMCAVIDPRGSLANVDDADCDEKRSFICDVTGGTCQALSPAPTTTTPVPTTTTTPVPTTTAPTTTSTPAPNRRAAHLAPCTVSDFAADTASDKVESVATCQVLSSLLVIWW